MAGKTQFLIHSFVKNNFSAKTAGSALHIEHRLHLIPHCIARSKI